MTTIHDLTPEQVHSAFTEYRARYAITNPPPQKPKSGRFEQVELRKSWRFWTFGPVALAGALVSAIRTLSAATGVAAISNVLPFVPPQVEAALVVIAVDFTIVIGMVVLTYSRLQHLKIAELRQEMEKMRFLKYAIILAFFIALAANVTQVIREQFQSISQIIDFGFDLGTALAFSVGMVVLALIGAEQLAYLMAWTRYENMELEREWKRSSDKAIVTYEENMQEWRASLHRSWDRNKSKVLGLSSAPKRVKIVQHYDSALSKDQKKELVLSLIVRNGHEEVTYAEIKDQLSSIPRSSFYVYVNELIEEGKVQKGRIGWRKPVQEGF